MQVTEHSPIVVGGRLSLQPPSGRLPALPPELVDRPAKADQPADDIGSRVLVDVAEFVLNTHVEPAGKPDPRVVTPPDTPEGVFEEFRALTRRLLSVPKAVIDKREREYRKRRRRS